MKRLLFAGVLGCASLVSAQTDNTLYVKNFPGVTVGAKVSAAMLACNPNPVVPCIIVLDPSLATWAAGSIPTLCAQCSIADYRLGSIVPSLPGVTSDGSNGMHVAGTVAAATIAPPTNLAQSQLNLNVNGSVLPSAFPLLWEGSSIGFGWNSQGDTYISASSAGSGYSGSGIVTVSGGTCTTAPAINASTMPSGGLVFALTNAGACTVVPTTAAISGFTGGSGASVTLTRYGNPYPQPWTLRVTTLPAMNGRVSSFLNDSVSGSTVFDVLGRYTIDGTAAFCSQANAVIAIDGGILGNSLGGGNGLPAPQGGTGSAESPVAPSPLYAQWLALTHAYKNAGCKVIVTTMIPRGGGVSGSMTLALLEQYRQQINNLIRTGTKGTDYDWLVDLGGKVQDFNNPYIYSTVDQVHPNATGQIVLAQLTDAALNSSGLIDSVGSPMPFTNDQLAYGLSVAGNNTNYQLNSVSFGSFSGTEYETLVGPAPVTFSGFVLRDCDSLVTTCVTVETIDGQGVPTFNSGLGAQGSNTNWAPNGSFWSIFSATQYQTETGPSVGVRNSFTLRQCDSAGNNCVSPIASNSLGVLQGPASFSPIVTGSWCAAGSTACMEKRTATCSTSAVQFNVCNTTVTWGGTWADTNYTAVCTLDSANVSALVANTGLKSTTQITVGVMTMTAAALTSGTVSCVGVHD